MKLSVSLLFDWVCVLLSVSGLSSDDRQAIYRISAPMPMKIGSAMMLPHDSQSDTRLSSSTFSTPPEHVSIAALLADGGDFHQQLVAVRGSIVQPELHLDESQLFLDFVFRLSQGSDSVVVFGRHDRTRGAPSISMNLAVEVVGIFWKTRDFRGSVITNVIEAQSVAPYPSSLPDRA